jgi:hypothetical protein
MLSLTCHSYLMLDLISAIVKRKRPNLYISVTRCHTGVIKDIVKTTPLTLYSGHLLPLNLTLFLYIMTSDS